MLMRGRQNADAGMWASRCGYRHHDSSVRNFPKNYAPADKNGDETYGKNKRVNAKHWPRWSQASPAWAFLSRLLSK